jgi:hypothetical protein
VGGRVFFVHSGRLQNARQMNKERSITQRMSHG